MDTYKGQSESLGDKIPYSWLQFLGGKTLFEEYDINNVIDEKEHIRPSGQEYAEHPMSVNVEQLLTKIYARASSIAYLNYIIEHMELENTFPSWVFEKLQKEMGFTELKSNIKKLRNFHTIQEGEYIEELKGEGQLRISTYLKQPSGLYAKTPTPNTHKSRLVTKFLKFDILIQNNTFGVLATVPFDYPQSPALFKIPLNNSKGVAFDKIPTLPQEENRGQKELRFHSIQVSCIYIYVGN